MTHNETGWGQSTKPTPPIALYTYLMSPFGARVHAVLLHKKRPFNIKFVNPTRRRYELPVGHVIPVLAVGEDNFTESNEIIKMLDKEFPDPPVYPDDPGTRARIDEFLLWVDMLLVPYLFASAIPKVTLELPERLRRGWRLGQLMHMTVPAGLPYMLRAAWPAILRSQPFIQRLADMATRKGDLATLRSDLHDRFVSELGAGPFVFEQTIPTLADLVCYATVAPPYLTSVLAHPFGDSDPVCNWLALMEEHLAGNPPLVPIHCLRVNVTLIR